MHELQYQQFESYPDVAPESALCCVMFGNAEDSIFVDIATESQVIVSRYVNKTLILNLEPGFNTEGYVALINEGDSDEYIRYVSVANTEDIEVRLILDADKFSDIRQRVITLQFAPEFEWPN